MEKNDLVSIIMPCFNGSRYIKDAIASVINQHYENWELIVIDDCSIDNSAEIIESYAKSDLRILFLRNESNKGVIFTRNRAIEIAKGRYIAFLDCDDLWLSSKLNAQVSFLTKVSGSFCFSNYDVIDSEGNIVGKHRVPEKINYSSLLERCDIGCSTVLYDVSKIGKFYFDSSAPSTGEDYVMWLQIIKVIPEGNMFGLRETVVMYRKHDGGISANKVKAALNIWKVYFKFERIGFFKSTFYLVKYFVYWLDKHKKDRRD